MDAIEVLHIEVFHQQLVEGGGGTHGHCCRERLLLLLVLEDLVAIAISFIMESASLPS